MLKKTSVEPNAPVTSTAPCHVCGTSGRGCRTVAGGGYWCQRDGLIGHEWTILRTPDPVEIAWTTDAEVVAAEETMNAAATAYDWAQTARFTAINACSAAGVEVPDVVGLMSLSVNAARARVLRDEPGNASALRLAVVDANEALDDAAVTLSKARVQYNETVRRVHSHYRYGPQRGVASRSICR